MILVKLPSRSRPQQFLRVLKGWVDKAHDLSGITWLFSFDTDDPTMQDMHRHLEPMLGNRYKVVYGTSKSKVEAINRDINEVTEPWDVLLVLSDDMVCVRQGWDAAIRMEVAKGGGLFWWPDQKQQDIVTLPCMTRRYYDLDGHVYDPRFKSVYCDNLQTDLSVHRGELRIMDYRLADHIHPANVQGMRPDALYRRNESIAIWKEDEATYKRLKP